MVQEEGRRQTVESFEPVIVRGGRPAARDEPPRLTGARLRAPSEGRCLLIFIDDIHVSPPTMERVRVSLRRFLEMDVREGDWVTVVAPEQQLWWTARNAWGSTSSSRASWADSPARARATRPATGQQCVRSSTARRAWMPRRAW